MKTNLLLGAVTFLAGSLLAADSDNSASAVKAAAKKLADQGNYSWTTTTKFEGGGGGGGGQFVTEGKTQDGATSLSMTRGDNTMEAVLKGGGKGALKLEGEWKSLSEAAEGDGNRGQFIARMLQNYKVPAAEAEELVGKCKELKLAEGTYAGDLTEAAAKQLLTFRRGGNDGPSVSGAKGSAKFWVKDGQLSKFEYNLQGTVSFNNNDRDVNRTMTIEIKDVGTTKVSVPEGAAKKLS